MDTANTTIQKTLKPVQDIFSNNVSPFVDNPIVSLIISYLVVISIIYTVEDIPVYLKNIFKNPLFKVFSIFIYVYSVTKKVDTALLTSVSIVSLFYMIKILVENFELILPSTDSYPGCVDVKISDLLQLFDGDRSKLKKSMYISGVPLDIELTDTNAPLIATYLINFGHKVTDNCKPPM